MQRIRIINQLRRRFWVLFGLGSLAVGALLYLWRDWDHYRSRFDDYLSRRVEKQFGLKLTTGSVKTDAFGFIRIGQVKVWVPAEPNDELLFEARQLQFRYNLIDFIRKSYTGRLEVTVEEPVFYADIPFVPKGPDLSNVPVYTRILTRLKPEWAVHVRNGRIIWKNAVGVVSGITGNAGDGRFDFKVLLRHLRLGPYDLSTELVANGAYRMPTELAEPYLNTRLRTRGTIVNFKPVESESELELELRSEHWLLKQADLLGGIHLDGWIAGAETTSFELKILAKDYPLNRLSPFILTPDSEKPPGSLDSEIRLTGSNLEPAINAHIHVKNSRLGSRSFKALVLELAGLLPEVELRNSRIILEDGTTMDFADRSIHIQDLFTYNTYRQLVSDRFQEEVVWGDWRMKRGLEANSMSFEREVADGMKLKYERATVDESQFEPGETPDEVSMEYKLSEDNRFKVEVKEGEEFVGIERKHSF